MRVCAVTGATGFLGSYIIDKLGGQGVQPVNFSRNTVDFSDSDGICSELRSHKVTDVIHLAAQANPASSDISTYYESNSFLTERLLAAAAKTKLPGKFIFISATSVYGNTENSEQSEEAPLKPLNHYGASKLLAELYCNWYRDTLDITVARPSNCIGAGQNPQYLVPKLTRMFAHKENEIIMGDTEISRDFIDVRDAADIIVRCLDLRYGEIPVLNVSTGKATSIKSILDTLKSLTGHDPKIVRDESFIRAGDIRFQSCNNELAKRTGHIQKYKLADSLQWMLNEYKL